MAEQIFISHSSKDNACVERLYNHLIDDRYWVWMDKKNLTGGEEWAPQINENLRKAKIFLVLFSPASLESDWVRHEGSMAFALDQLIVPVNIEPERSYLTRDLPLWTRHIQLMELYDGLPEYADQLQLLKQRLGTPIPIRQFLLQNLEHYKRDGVLSKVRKMALSLRIYLISCRNTIIQ
jgi:TIR domain